MSDDMTLTVIPKSDQLNADDLIGGPRTITITRMAIDPTSDQPVAVYFQGDNGKPYKACKSMRRVMIHAWGPDASKYAGQSMTIYRDPSVMFGGMQVGGIRISAMSGLDKPLTMALTATKAKRALYTVKPLVIAKPEPPKPQDHVPTIETAKTRIQLLSAISSALYTAPDRAAVDAILSHDRVGKAMAALSEDDRAKMDKNVTVALDRTAPPPTDTPNDGWTTEADGVLPLPPSTRKSAASPTA
jgi:hypothetical protein